MFSERIAYEKATRLAWIGSRLSTSPLEALFGLLVFILCKNFDINPLQVTLFVSIKPMSAFLAFYASPILEGNPHRLKKFIVFSQIVGAIPCLLFPFVESSWYFVISSIIFMMTNRAVIPAWSEILKINLEVDQRPKVFSQGSTIGYVFHVLTPLLVAPWIDSHPSSWKWSFFSFGFFQLLSIPLLSFLTIKTPDISSVVNQPRGLCSFRSIFLGPWKNCWILLKTRKDFRRFQIAFMLGGSGLMLMHPALPGFFNEVLNLSYTSLSLAMNLCKGLAFVFTSSFWARYLGKTSIYLFICLVVVLAGFFPILVILSASNILFLYLAYLVYGAMQAGSELSWNLSGPLFSKDQDSTLFTGVNVALVGVRGTIAPFLGGLLLFYSSPIQVFIVGSFLCFIGGGHAYLSFLSERESRREAANPS